MALTDGEGTNKGCFYGGKQNVNGTKMWVDRAGWRGERAPERAGLEPKWHWTMPAGSDFFHVYISADT